jgi:predicted amidohydrolase
MNSQKGELAGNLEQHLALLEEAAQQGCDVAVFPEFSLTGSVDPISHPERAIGVEADAVRSLVQATRRLRTAAVFGVAERTDHGFYITQLFAEGGVLRGCHRKRHLGEDEAGYETGRESPVCELAGIRCGIVICAEAARSSLWADLAAAGASVVFFCAAPGLYGRRTDEAGWQAGHAWWEDCGLGDARREARAHHLWVALATQAGSTIDEDFPGLAALVDPAGEVVDRTPDWRAGTLLVRLTSLPPAE